MSVLFTTFTTARVRNGSVWFWEDHVARLGVDVGQARVLAACAGIRDARVRITAETIEARAYEPPRAPWRLRPVTASPPGDSVRLKTTDRGYHEAARAEAAGFDDALLVLEDGRFLECSVANVVVEREDGCLVTPPASLPLLPGIVRARLRSVCEEMPLRAADFARARACCVTNALLIAHPVREIEGVGRFDSLELARTLMQVVAESAPETRIIE